MTVARAGAAINDETFTAAATDNATRVFERGQSILVGVTWGNPSSRLLTSVTCSGEQNLTLIGSPVVDGTLGQAVQFAYLSKVLAAGNKTITINFDGACDGDWWIMSYAGADLQQFYDLGTLANASGNSAAPSVNVVPVMDNSLIVGYAANNPGGFTVGGAYTVLAGGSSFQIVSAEDDVDGGAAGSRAVNYTSTSSAWLMVGLAFRPALPSLGILRSNAFGLF
jgi:hypothetical protein